MTVTINLSDNLAQQLIIHAQTRHIPVDELATNLLTQALHNIEQDTVIDDLDSLVAKIRATATESTLVQHATASLNLLLGLPSYVTTDDGETRLSSAEWDQAWAKFEADEKATDCIDELADNQPSIA